MVRGVEKFKEYFKDYSGQYVFIGGAACDLLLGSIGEDFRATKDLDIVLLLDELQEDFGNVFLHFIDDGGYEHIDKGSGKEQFYRFSKPKDSQFPYMIELFSKRPDYLDSFLTGLAPIHISDDSVSLSAILLDDDYYELLRSGITTVDGVTVLALEQIALFKMKAWLDLSDRKQAGEQIDSKNVRKHKNDVFRLVASMEKDSKLSVSGAILQDVNQFIDNVRENPVDLKNLNIRHVTFDELITKIKSVYGVS